MTIATILGVVAVGVTAVLGTALWCTAVRLRRVEARTARLEYDLRGRVEPDVATALAEARDATVTARRASVAAGVDEPPPRLPFEPVTGRVVRAVAFGAGARRALARAAAPGWSRRGLRRTA